MVSVVAETQTRVDPGVPAVVVHTAVPVMQLLASGDRASAADTDHQRLGVLGAGHLHGAHQRLLQLAVAYLRPHDRGARLRGHGRHVRRRHVDDWHICWGYVFLPWTTYHRKYIFLTKISLLGSLASDSY